MKTIPNVKIFAASILLITGASHAETTANDHAAQICAVRLFSQPLAWVGTREPPDAESVALLADIRVFETNGVNAGMDGLEKFLKAYPESSWAPSLHVNLAEQARSHGRYSLALAHWEAAWDATKGSNGRSAQKIAARTIAGWTRLLGSLGEKQKLDALFKEVNHLQLPFGAYGTTIEETEEGLAMMKAKPGIAYRCGSYALGNLAQALHLDKQISQNLFNAGSPDGGFNVSELLALARSNGMAVAAVRRPAGAEIVVPSVVHWKLNHYAAIIERKGNRYRVEDPTFEGYVWMDAQTIDAETGGVFILPKDKVPAAWQKLTEAECAQIYGKGLPFLFNDANDDAPDCGGDQEDSNCDPPTPNDGDSGDGAPPSPGCPLDCSTLLGIDSAGIAIGIASAGALGGMPQWRVSEPYITLWLEDMPLTYRLSNGQWMRFVLSYKSRGGMQDSYASGFGDKWSCTWLGKLQSFGSGATNFLAGGGMAAFGATPEFKSARVYFGAVEGGDEGGDGGGGGGGSSVGLISTPQLAVNSYEISYDDYVGDRSFLLTKRVDRYGRILEQFNYETNGNLLRMTNVLDMDGRTNTIVYGNSTYPNLITAVTDPYGQTAYFNYDGVGRLTSIQDMQGMTSYFQYDGDEHIIQMTTPYGTTAFTYFDGIDTNHYEVIGTVTNYAPLRALLITEPTGDHQLYAYSDQSPDPTIPFQMPSQPVTYHWNRSQYNGISDTGKNNVLSMPAADYALAPVKYWLFDGSSGYMVSDTMGQIADAYDPVLQSRPGRVEYDYRGESEHDGYNNSGSSGALKRITAISLWNGQNSFYPVEGITRSAFGRPTSYVYYSQGATSMVYTNNFDASGQNLQNEQGPRGEPTRGYGYDLVRTNLLIAVTNSAGDVIRYTHDTNTLKVTSILFPGGLVRTNIYYTNGPSKGFLLMQIDLGFHTNSFAWQNGNLAAQTNELGLVTTYLYDNLNRVISSTFPDGTTVSNVYDKLDLVATKDRLNQWTYYGYNAVRQLMAVTNANGQVTTYDYCGCGAPDLITRWNGSTPLYTQFYYDIGGRLTNTVYPDGYQLFYSYDLNNQVQSVADNGGHELELALLQIGLFFKVQVASLYSPYGSVQLVNRMFDEYGRVTNSTDADLVRTGFGYDSLDRLVWRQSFGSGGTQTGQESFGYSALGLANYTDPLGHVTKFVRDAAGRVLYETNANNEVLQFTYNPADELLTLTDGKNQTTTWNYDGYGRVTNKVDVAGITNFVYQYDADDRLTNRWTPAKGTTVYRYDPIGNLTNVIYPVSSNLVFRYDGLNRLVAMADAVGATAFSWTPGDQLAGETGPWPYDAVTYTYTNRQRSVMSVPAPNADAWVQGYSYDEFMRLTGTISPAGNFSYGYAEFDEVAGYSVGYNSVNNAYDGLGRLWSTELDGPLYPYQLNHHSYQYDQGSEVTQQTFTAGNVMNYTYDNIGQLQTARGYESGGTTQRLQEQFGYAYDKAWNLNYRTNNALIQSFAVNNVNELSSASRSGTLTVAGTTTEASSVTSVTVNGQSANQYADGTFAASGFTPANGNNTFTAVALDSYGRQDSSSVTAYLPASPSYTYDLNGDLLSDGTRNFAYDDENQLVSVWAANTWSNRFTYDGLLRKRIERDYAWNGSSWIKTNEVRLIYDGYLVLQERDANNLPQVTYTRGLDLSGTLQDAGGIGGLLARTVNPSTLNPQLSATATTYYQADGNGNITCMVDASGRIVAHYEYDPYGNMLSMSGPLAGANRYRFSSKEWNDSAGLYYYGFRFYDPNLQRWPNRDPIQELGGVNIYVFAFNSPLTWIDLLGLCNLTFDGSHLYYYGDQGELLGVYNAESGLNGSTDFREKNKGPIPPGNYTIDPNEISKAGFWRPFTGNWGDYRAPLHPNPGTDTFGRSGFFLHGGQGPSTKGCIKIGSNDKVLLPELQKEKGPIGVKVSYPPPPPHAVPPICSTCYYNSPPVTIHL